MTNREVWEHYRDYTKDITEYSRKLGFAGAAICWFFKAPDFKFPIWILISFLFLLAFFVCDLSQSLVAAYRHRGWIRREEIKNFEETGKIEGDYQKPWGLDIPVFRLFILKVVCLFVAYVFV